MEVPRKRIVADEVQTRREGLDFVGFIVKRAREDEWIRESITSRVETARDQKQPMSYPSIYTFQKHKEKKMGGIYLPMLTYRKRMYVLSSKQGSLRLKCGPRL